MDILTLPILQNAFNDARSYIVSKGSEWAGHIVVKFQSNKVYLQDPLIASATLFCVNFIILEVSIRISQLAATILPKQTETHKHIRKAFAMTLAGGMVLGGNVAFAKVAEISLNPFIMTAVVLVAFLTKYSLESYLQHKSSTSVEGI